jgi:integrase
MENNKRHGAYGTGSLFKRKGSPNWYIQVYDHGRPRQLSSRTTSKAQALKKLAKYHGMAAIGQAIGAVYETVTVGEVLDDYVEKLKREKVKRGPTAKKKFRWLWEYFGNMPYKTINMDRLLAYEKWRREGMKRWLSRRGSIGDGLDGNRILNIDFQFLRAASSYAFKTTQKVYHIIGIPRYAEREARGDETEWTDEEYLFYRDRLPDYLRGILTIGYWTGWRVSEICNLDWDHVDLNMNVTRIKSGEGKTGKPRILPIDVNPEIAEIFKMQWQRKMRENPPHNYVFGNWANLNKVRIKIVENNIRRINQETGLNKIFHGLRHTAPNVLRRAGVEERVRLSITGHVKDSKAAHDYEHFLVEEQREALKKAFMKVQEEREGRKGKVIKLDQWK